MTEVKTDEVKPLIVQPPILPPTTALNFTELPAVQNKLNDLFLGNDQKKQMFMTNLLSVVNGNDLLKKATRQSIWNASMIAAGLDLPLSPSLGFAYIVPYNKKLPQADPNDPKKTIWIEQPPQGQLQIGYKGMRQLALRSGLLQTFETTVIYQNQIIKLDYLRGHQFDTSIKGDGEIVGYAGYMKLITGYEKTVYITKVEAMSHGKRYSKSFENASGLWKTDPDIMAKKTVAKRLLESAPMTTEIQNAITYDQSVIGEDMKPDYIDNIDNITPPLGNEWDTE